MAGEWFKDWFNTPYYHILYKSRDDSEASAFIDRLIDYLQPGKDCRFLDVACGKGRHSIYLNSKGYDVTGIDISPNNIEEACKSSNARLHFFVEDMRRPFTFSEYNIALNLFTSFGYFDNRTDNLLALQNIYRALTPGGIFVLDFFNAHKVLLLLVPQETKTLEGITFTINKRVENNRIIKTIQFADKGQNYAYTEKVEAINREEFEKLFEEAGFEITAEFGDYHFASFDNNTSDRLVIVAQKR